jgi:hypothetical protein
MSSQRRRQRQSVTNELNNLLDVFIEAIVLSIPIFFLALSLWSKGFEVVANGIVETYYLTDSGYDKFILQTGLVALSLALAIIGRIILDKKWKRRLSYSAIVIYLGSIILFVMMMMSLSIS